MITLLLLILLSSVIFFLIKSIIYHWHNDNTDCFMGLGLLTIGFIIIIAILLGGLITNINSVNKLKAQNIHMLPKDILEKNIAVKNAELNDIKAQIKKASDKNQFQVKIDKLNGLSVYTMPMSANRTSFEGLGDIERGGAEKLILLESLIEKQREIANDIINAQKELSRDEYYKRNAEIMVYENSLLDGLLVRWFSITAQQDLRLIENKTYYPKDN